VKNPKTSRLMIVTKKAGEAGSGSYSAESSNGQQKAKQKVITRGKRKEGTWSTEKETSIGDNKPQMGGA